MPQSDIEIKKPVKAHMRKPHILMALIIAAGALFGFGKILTEVLEGESRAVDEFILLKMRDAVDPSNPWGPGWLEEMMRDITALGGTAILTLVTLSTVIYLVAKQKRGQALYLFCAVSSGMVLSNLIKMGIDRPRPELVPHGSIVYLPSFPSGHSLISAVVYLTLGALLAEVHSARRMKYYFMGLASVIVILIGVSRVYLGVHWPSDVLAGWMMGLAWALLFWAANHYIKIRRA